MKKAQNKTVKRRTISRFGTMYPVSGVVLIKSNSDRVFGKMSKGCLEAPADVLIRQYARRRAILLRSYAAERTGVAMHKASISVDLLAKKLLRAGAARAIAGYSPSGQNVPPFIFPTGAIFVLMDPKCMQDVMRVVRRFPLQSIRRMARAPVLKIQLRPGQEGNAGILEEHVARVPGVLAATADFSYYGTYQRIIHQPPSERPSLDRSTMLVENLVYRAWEFGLGKDGIDVAVLDGNFYDHPDIVYRLDHGYDAADGDHDPRSPLSPPDADVTSPIFYRHGTYMSGVIASRGTVNPDFGTGVAPHSHILPIREEDVSVDYRDDFDAFLDEWVNEWIQAIVEIYYSGVPVANASFDLGLDLGVIPYSWFAWFNWLTGLPQGPHVFMSVSAGNNPNHMQVSSLARRPFAFAVGWATRQGEVRMGNGGVDLDISVAAGTWGALEPDGNVLEMGYDKGGTSVAAAIVSGVAALIRAQGNYNSLDITDILRWTAARSKWYEATADANGQSPELGYGYLDAFAAVKQAHKGKGAARRLLSIKFLPLSCALVEQVGANPWFWCLEKRHDVSGDYWGHWKPTAPFADISAGANIKGHALIVADFNGDGIDEIAVQQAGARSNCFDIIHFNTHHDDWFRMGHSQDNTGSAFVWGPINSAIGQVLAADVDGDGRAELVALRGANIDQAKFSVSQNMWKKFGPDMAPLQLLNARDILRTGEEISSTTVLDLSVRAWHRPSLHRDVILALSSVLVRISRSDALLFPPALHHRTVLIQALSQHEYTGNSSAPWISPPFDYGGPTHIPMPFTQNMILADIDGDGVDEVVLLYPDDHNKMITIDISDPFADASQVGYVTISSEWNWPGTPSELVPVKIQLIPTPKIHELAYLESDDTTDRVRFLRWHRESRSWSLSRTFSRKKLGNPALSLKAGDFDGDGLDEIALLMAKPFGNTYHVFRSWGDQIVFVGEL